MKNDKMFFYSNFGYNYFGPLLLGFVKWLNEKLKSEKIDKVYFLSRDGFVMKRAFDLIKDDSIKSYYFYASRRATIVPLLWKLKKEEDIFEVITFNKQIKVASFLKKVGLDNVDCIDILNEFNVSKDDMLDMNNTENFFPLLKKLFPIIKENSRREWKALEQYSYKMDFIGKVAIVDIGWYGTMQNSMEKLFPKNKIYGYYFGIVPNTKIAKSNYNGYIFSKNENIELYMKMHYFINIFEFLFLAQHGSVKKYINQNEVEFYDYEYINHDEKSIALNIQNSAINFIKKNKSMNVDTSDSIIKFINYFLYPSNYSSVRFGNIQFKDDDFKYIAKPKFLFFYFFNFKTLKNDFIDSSWRIGFLKRLFKIPLPYYKINNIIRNKFNYAKESKNENN